MKLANTTTYTGRSLDVETGLYYYRNRYYHAQLGRFVGRDLIGYEGSPYNLYEYVKGRPSDGVDPTGLVACSELNLVPPGRCQFKIDEGKEYVFAGVCTYRTRHINWMWPCGRFFYYRTHRSRRIYTYTCTEVLPGVFAWRPFLFPEEEPAEGWTDDEWADKQDNADGGWDE